MRHKYVLLVSALLISGLPVCAVTARAPDTEVSNLAGVVSSGDPVRSEMAGEQRRPSEPEQSTGEQPQIETAGVSGERGDRQNGDEFYCKQRALGRWFYCDKPKSDVPKPDAVDAAPLTGSQKVAAITKQLDELRDRAIIDPSERNILAFMKFQREQTDRASKMADMWERVLIAHPEQDYNLQRPESALAKQNWVDQRNKDMAQTMSELNKRYGLFYFFASKSRESQIQGPILRSLADTYGLTVVAVSEDYGPSDDFPDYLIDTGQRAKMGLPGKAVPMIALYDTVEHKTVLISTGIVAAQDIMQRVFLLTKTKPGEDY